MKIELKPITIRELVKGYKDNNEKGVVGFDGTLDIRPPYQREFIYGDKERDAVIDTVTKNFPLNVLYWAVRKDGNFEVIDGQQRTISICQYVNEDFSVDFSGKRLGFNNLTGDKKEQILNYTLMVYFCSGEDSEKLEWFETINIAGKPLTDQELKNAVYSGSWVTDAKRYFSKNGCAAYSLGSDYLIGTPIRQDYLETAIRWIADGDIKKYMSDHQHDPNAKVLWEYFQDVISWANQTFPIYRKEMKGIQWGILYNEFKDTTYDDAKIEEKISILMRDEDVTNKKGIYQYILTGKERFLNIRSFNDNNKREAYETQNGICPKCGNHFEINEMEADHITPWHSGGKTLSDNCQMLCKDDNRKKSGI